jgi:protein-S-isoprenylcysteine O-methyltransferase Ste14
MMVFGLILMSRRPWLFIFTMLALAPVYRRMARNEDEWLYAQIGPAAAEYRAFVSGFIPQFMPAKLPGVGRSVIGDGFSWSRSLWKRPGRASWALAGVGLSVCAQFVWTMQLVPHWVWFWLVGLLVAGALGWLIRDRRLQAAL